MELVATEEARLVALMLAVRPAGPLPLLTLINSIQDEFQFLSAPETTEDVSTDGLQFKNGSFDGVAIDSLSIHDDGIVIASRSSTEFLDRVLDHIVKWGQNECGFQLTKTHEIDKFYKSTVTIKTEKEILSALKVLSDLRTSFEQALFKDSGIKAPYEPFGISFACDHQQSLEKPSAFRIERKQGTNFKLNYYICEAPLQTKSQLSLLSELEKSC